MKVEENDMRNMYHHKAAIIIIKDSHKQLFFCLKCRRFPFFCRFEFWTSSLNTKLLHYRKRKSIISRWCCMDRGKKIKGIALQKFQRICQRSKKKNLFNQQSFSLFSPPHKTNHKNLWKLKAFNWRCFRILTKIKSHAITKLRLSTLVWLKQRKSKKCKI